jgi:hypothetical protein
MTKEVIHIYINPKADQSSYPDQLLYDDMSVFDGYRDEVQWLFYLMLREQGIDVRLCHDYPKDGIFVIFKGNVRKFIWNPDLFVVSLQWDYPRDDRAQVHLVSNTFSATEASMGRLDRLSFQGHPFYVSEVTHPVIIPRDPKRGDRFENITYIGDSRNLVDAFKTDSFKKRLQDMGMRFIINDNPHSMADYSEVDAVIAVRRFGQVISNKPPTKLINAWRGGVPSLLGCEIGYREARNSCYDYIEVDSIEEVFNGLDRLKNDIEFRNKMVEMGQQRMGPFMPDQVSATWSSFFTKTAIPMYHEWQSRSPLGKWTFLLIRWIRYAAREGMSLFWHQILGRRSRDYINKKR